MSPVLNCIPSSPPSDAEVFAKAGSIASDGSNRSPPEMVSSRANGGDYTESENSCSEDVKMEAEDSKQFSPTMNNNNNNNNNIPLNYKKSPSPNGPNSEGLVLEAVIRPWNSSPNFRHVDRDESVSPSSSSHRPSSCHRYSVSPDVSSEASRIPSQASSEAAQESILSPDSLRSSKVCGDIPYDVPFPFHDNRLSSTGSFRLSNSLISDPMSPYFRLGHPLNPFPPSPSPEFLPGNPFLGPNDPKLMLNSPGLGLITQSLHHLNGLSTNFGKIPPGDLHRMSVQQLQFLQNHLQNLPTILHQQQQQHHPPPISSFEKYSDPKAHLSMLMHARKLSKTGEPNGETPKRDPFTPLGARPEPGGKSKDRKFKPPDGALKHRKIPQEEAMQVDNGELNYSDSDEVLSVGSASPPQSQPPPKPETTPETRTNVSNGSSSKNPNRTLNGLDSAKYLNGIPPLRLPDSVTNTKTGNASNRTLKFSIDNILKSDFGNEDGVKDPTSNESKKPSESDRTLPAKPKPETEKEKPVDLTQDNSNGGGAGGEAPMLWPAWVYCTRYSDRPSSGPRTRRSKNKEKNPEEKRPRTAFSGDQLSRLKHEFAENRYLTERRRQDLARELGLNEAQIKIWFQNKRAKMKKARGEKNPLALQLMAQGLYNHSTIPLTKEEEEAAAAELSD